MSEPLLLLQNIGKYYSHEDGWIVRNVSFEVHEGEVLVILGSSGSGKTTVLKIINRLIEPSEGEIFLAGENIAAMRRVSLRRSMGYVFQEVGLFPHMTVEENVVLPLRLHQVPFKERHKKAIELLEIVNLNPIEFANRFPDELSGGQKQRVGVARSLASNPKLLLMDEPFGALDPITRDSMQQELLQIKKRFNKAVAFVTHDIFEALRLGDRIAVMHQGKIEQLGTKKELIQEPKTTYVQQLFQTSRQQAEFLAQDFEKGEN